MTSIASLPVLAVPVRPTSLVFTLTEFNSNWVRVWAVSAPAGSKLDAQINDGVGRAEIYAGQGGANHALTQVFDRGGHYVFAAQEFTKGASAYGGGHQDSPDSAQTETKVGAETTLDLYVGQRLTSPAGTGADTATLVLWVWNDSVRETLLTVQGEDTPAITEGRTPKAVAASVSVPVVAALAALIGETDPAGTMATVIATVRNKVAAHMADGATHTTPDTANQLPEAFATDPGQHLDDFANNQLVKLRGHLDNANTNGAAGSLAYHPTLDRINAPIVSSAGDQASGYVALADIWRSYEAHRASGTLHTAPDTLHALGTPPRLLALHVAFLNQLAANPSTPAPGQSTAAMQLIQKAGFEET